MQYIPTRPLKGCEPIQALPATDYFPVFFRNITPAFPAVFLLAIPQRTLVDIEKFPGPAPAGVDKTSPTATFTEARRTVHLVVFLPGVMASQKAAVPADCAGTNREGAAATAFT
jgi:hypothetical protein